jgi:HK97 family phage major capsid protein
MLSNANATGGYFLAPEISENVILDAMAKSVCLEAGVRVHPFSTPSVRFPALNFNANNVGFKAEGATGPFSTYTVGAKELAPVTVMGIVNVSNELLEDSELVQASIVQSLYAQILAKVDEAILMGSGSLVSGIFGTSGVTKTALNGVATREAIANAVYRVRNANFEPSAVIVSERERKNLQTLISEADDQPLFHLPYYDGIKILSTSQIPTNVATGSPSTNNGSYMFAGDFSKVVLGVRNEMQVSVANSGSDFERNTSSVRVTMRVAVAVLDNAACDITTDVTGS